MKNDALEVTEPSHEYYNPVTLCHTSSLTTLHYLTHSPEQ